MRKRADDASAAAAIDPHHRRRGVRRRARCGVSAGATGADRGAIELAGVGGRAMAAQGIVSPFPIDDLSIVGLTAIPQKLPTIFRHIREATRAVVAARPDALVIVDSPDFTHRVARRVRRIVPSIPILDYVSPSVWAWRPGRARAMRAYVDRVLAILPFEPAAYMRLKGPPCSLCRPSADRAAGRIAAECAGGGAPAERPADRAGACPAAGRPRSGAISTFSARRSTAVAARAGADRGRAADRAASRFAGPRGGGGLGGRAAHRGRAGGEMGCLPLGARGACGIRDGHARTRAIRRADGRRLSPASP